VFISVYFSFLFLYRLISLSCFYINKFFSLLFLYHISGCDAQKIFHPKTNRT
ncbi:hypothetical protein LOTGIDRAFT_140407, partial [Lottia gigantea]